MKERILAFVLMTALAGISVHGQTLTVAVIRVDFPVDDSPATAGDGQFLQTDQSGLICSEWVLDPPPHDSQYFKDHLKAANNYWNRVSAGNVRIDTVNSKVFPVHPDSAFTMPHDMLYYQPYLEDFDETEKLMEFSRDAVELADPFVDFSDFTTVMIVHAGMGGDFAFALDPTPGNIPSAYLTETDFAEYGNIQTGEGNLDDLIIIPESQNFMQYQETRSLFEESSDPCFYQVGLNGTIALMLGFHLGLPPMYDTESGQSLLGGFALMDQGSNNWHGIVPAYPNPYTRIQKGWTSPVSKGIGDHHASLHVSDPPVKVQISSSEYYLIENRQRNLVDPPNMTAWIDTLAGDTVSVLRGTSGVVIDVDEQHAGLPGNGLYIWHINEAAEHTAENPNGGTYQLVDFIEADGAQDMGNKTQLIFADFLETGWWFDAWFADNEGWFDLNRDDDDTTLHFSSRSFPSTTTSAGLDTYLRIDNISANGSTMSFSIGSDRLVNTTSLREIFGWEGATANLWGLSEYDNQIELYNVSATGLDSLNQSDLNPDSIYTTNPDSGFIFRYPWISPNQQGGAKLFSLNDNQSYTFSALDSIFELRLDPDSMGVQFFARTDGGYINTHISSGQVTQSTVSGHPLTDFGDTQLPIMVDPISVAVPKPFSVLNSDLHGAERVTVAWESEESEPRIVGSRGSNPVFSLAVGSLKHLIPVDTDGDGAFEIALFEADQVRIVNQAGYSWNGNPFSIEAYIGNPVVAPFLDNEPGIFLRHEESYTIHDLQGDLLDQGLLPEAQDGIKNSARVAGEAIFLLSGNDLLYFTTGQSGEESLTWLEEQGNSLGNRTVVMSGAPESMDQSARKSVYNYPNPIKGQSTTIRAWLGDVETWSIEIFSVNGSQSDYIELDVDQKYAYNEWAWDASSVSNGVYLAHIVAGEFSEVIKIAVIR